MRLKRRKFEVETVFLLDTNTPMGTDSHLDTNSIKIFCTD